MMAKKISELPGRRRIPLFAFVCLLAILIIVPSIQAQPREIQRRSATKQRIHLPPHDQWIISSNLKTPPPTRDVQVKPLTVKENRLQPITYRAFTFEELRDPKTGAPVRPDTIITLKKGRKITGQQLIDELNDLEKRYNSYGYSLRRTTKGPREIKIKETIIKKDMLDKQRSRIKKPVTPKDVPVRTYDLAKLQTAARTQPVEALLTPVNTPPTTPSTTDVTPVSDGQVYGPVTWGDPDYFSTKIFGTAKIEANKDLLTTYAQGTATLTLFNFEFPPIVDLQANAKIASGKSGGVGEATLRTTVLGNDLFPPMSERVGLAIQDDRSQAVDKSVKIPAVQLGPFSVVVTLGFYGRVGATYGIYVNLASINASVMPYVETGAYGQAGLNAGIVLLDFEAGVGADLTLLNDYLDIGTAVGINWDTPQPYLYWEYYGLNSMDTLSGEIYAYLTVDYWIDSDTWRWDIYKWDGFGFNDYVFRKAPVKMYLGTSTQVPDESVLQIQAPEDWTVTIYEHDNRQGAKKEYFLDMGQHQKTVQNIEKMNDKVSSVVIGKNVRVRLFEHADFGGNSLKLTPGPYDKTALQVNSLRPQNFNDKVSSLIVYPLTMSEPVGVWLKGGGVANRFYPATKCNVGVQTVYDEYKKVPRGATTLEITMTDPRPPGWGVIRVDVWNNPDCKGKPIKTYTDNRGSGGKWSLPKELIATGPAYGYSNSIRITCSGKPPGR